MDLTFIYPRIQDLVEPEKSSPTSTFSAAWLQPAGRGRQPDRCGSRDQAPQPATLLYP
jgi:hypothetical protein